MRSFKRSLQNGGGIVLDLDVNTAQHLDFRCARVRVGVCDPQHIPQGAWIPYTDEEGHVERYHIGMEVEERIGEGDNRRGRGPVHQPVQGGGGGEAGYNGSQNRNLNRGGSNISGNQMESPEVGDVRTVDSMQTDMSSENIAKNAQSSVQSKASEGKEPSQQKKIAPGTADALFQQVARDGGSVNKEGGSLGVELTNALTSQQQVMYSDPDGIITLGEDDKNSVDSFEDMMKEIEVGRADMTQDEVIDMMVSNDKKNRGSNSGGFTPGQEVEGEQTAIITVPMGLHDNEKEENTADEAMHTPHKNQEMVADASLITNPGANFD